MGLSEFGNHAGWRRNPGGDVTFIQYIRPDWLEDGNCLITRFALTATSQHRTAVHQAQLKSSA